MRALVKIWSLTVLYTLSAHCFAQTTYQLKGAVKEASNTTIPNAIIQYDSYVIHTDIDGAFEINFNGKLYLKISAIGFETFYDTLNIQADVALIFSMKKISREIGQVVIEEEASRFENFKTINKIETTEIKQTPSASGIPDVFSSMKTQPGVQSNTEGQKGLIIRGGNYDQSTTYVDGVPVMGSSHLFGLLSMFQTDCIKNVTLYNGYKPVKFGATLGPAIEINLKEKFTQEMQNSGSLSTSVISTQIQSTISDKNLFLQVGLRKSNLFLIQNLIDKAINNNGSKVVSPVYAFGDVTIKGSYLFKNQKLEVLHIRSSDEVNYDVEFVATERKYENSMSWTNYASAVNWHYYTDGGATFYADLVSNRYNSNLHSNNRILFWDSEENENIWRNSISEFDNTIETLKSTLSIEKKVSARTWMNLGLQYKLSDVAPNSFEFWKDVPPSSEDEFSGNREVETYTGFAELSGDVFEKASYNIGVRMSMFKYSKESEIHLNPRLSFTHQLTERLGLNFYSLISSQDVHLITLNSFGFIPELWMAPSQSKPIQRSWSSGLKVNYARKKTALFFDVYLRGMSNQLAFSEDIDFNDSTSEIVENSIETHGQGAVVGLEFSLKSSFKKFNYNLSYSYGKSSRLFEMLNQGKAFPFAFDIRHDASLVFTYNISDHFKFSALYTFSSGRVLNIQNQMVPIGLTNPLGGAYTQWVTYNQPQNRNSYRLGNVNRFDWNVTWTKKVSYGMYSIQLGVYNTTNNINPYSAIVTNDENGDQHIEEIGLIPLMPNLNLSFAWN